MSIRGRSRVVSYLMSLFVLGASVWLPTSAMAQLVPGGGGFGGGSGGTSFPVSDAVFQVCDDGDPTKCVQIQASGITTGNNTVPLTFAGTTAAPTVQFAAGAVGLPSIKLAGGQDGIWQRAGGVIDFSSGGNWAFEINAAATGIIIPSTGQFGMSSSTTAGSGIDTGLRRLSAGVWTQRGGTATSIGSLMGGGAAVASADPLPVPTGLVFHVSGTTNFTNITATNMITGAAFCMIFDGILTITDGGNLKLSANYTTSADDVLCVTFDGTNYYETSRSVN